MANKGDHGTNDERPGTHRGAASWQLDPFGRHAERWWDGSRWSDKIRSDGVAGIDPPGIVAAPRDRTARDAVAPPIDGAAAPLRYSPTNLPRVLLLGVLLLVVIVALITFGVISAA